MTFFENILQRLGDRKLTDVLVTGYLDKGEQFKHFHPMFEDVYFQFSDTLLRASSTDQYWNLRLSLTDRLDCSFEIDEDDEFCICSIYHFTVKYPEGDNFIRALSVFWGADSRLEQGVVKCAALRLVCVGQEPMEDTIFIDPEHTYGIRLGSEAQLSEWKDRYTGSTGVGSDFNLQHYTRPLGWSPE